MPPNFVRLDTTLPDVARLVTAMLQARDAVERQSWWHPRDARGWSSKIGKSAFGGKPENICSL